jgi:hypothetical protein
MELSGIALRGLDRAQSRFERAAERLTATGADSPDGAPADTVDLSAATVGLLAARAEFAAQIQLLKVADEMERRAFDVLA